MTFRTDGTRPAATTDAVVGTGVRPSRSEHAAAATVTGPVAWRAVAGAVGSTRGRVGVNEAAGASLPARLRIVARRGTRLEEALVGNFIGLDLHPGQITRRLRGGVRPQRAAQGCRRPGATDSTCRLKARRWIGLDHALASQPVYTDRAEFDLPTTPTQRRPGALDGGAHRPAHFEELIRAYLERITYGADGWAEQLRRPVSLSSTSGPLAITPARSVPTSSHSSPARPRSSCGTSLTSPVRSTVPALDFLRWQRSLPSAATASRCVSAAWRSESKVPSQRGRASSSGPRSTADCWSRRAAARTRSSRFARR
jgi:hypothetical protein